MGGCSTESEHRWKKVSTFKTEERNAFPSLRPRGQNCCAQNSPPLQLSEADRSGQVRCCCSPAPGHCVEVFEYQKMALKTENATRAKPLHFKALYIELIVTYLYLYTPELSSVYF